jgi:hypothetical protein
MVGAAPPVNMLTEAAKSAASGRYQTRARSPVRRRPYRGRAGAPQRRGAARQIGGAASGGFEANPEWRTRHSTGLISPLVRGSRFNTATASAWRSGISKPARQLVGRHAVGWEMNAPEFGDLAVGDQFQKHSYPFAIMVNATGKRLSTKAPTSAITPCEIRPRHPGAVEPVRLADFRSEGEASATRRISHPPDHQGDRR